jgi:uncharacterized membrane protein YphA (DoxX/SURF4 family)
MNETVGRTASKLAKWVEQLQQRRWAPACVANLRLLIGFAFVPAGLKKVLGEPFTAAENVGPFHEFLHAFHATGFFYRFVGLTQLLAAVLLLSQRWAWLGAALALPLITAILTFCWSTGVYPTACVVSLLFLGVLALLLWDLPRWQRVLSLGEGAASSQEWGQDARPWQASGVVISLLYLGACALAGGVYRPRGAEWGQPAFYLLVSSGLTPLVAWAYALLSARRAEESGAAVRR